MAPGAWLQGPCRVMWGSRVHASPRSHPGHTLQDLVDAVSSLWLVEFSSLAPGSEPVTFLGCKSL